MRDTTTTPWRRRGVLAVALTCAVLALCWSIARRPEPRAATVHGAASGVIAAANPTQVGAPRRNAYVAPHADGESRATADAVQQHLLAIAASGDPHQRLLALRLLLADHGDPAALQHARELAADLLADSPHDEMIAIAQTWFCGRETPCSPQATSAWRLAAPDNAAAYLGELPASSTDATAVDDLLARAASGGRYDAQFRSMSLETIAAFDDLALPPAGPAERAALRGMRLGATDDDRRRVLASSFVFALPLPPLRGLASACKPPLSSARFANCYAILRRMATATTVIEHTIAVGMLANLTRGTPEGAYWAREQLDARWRSRNVAQLPLDAQYWQDFVHFGEVETVRRALLRAHIPLTAPPGWTNAPG